MSICTVTPPAAEGGKPRKVWRYTMSLKNFARASGSAAAGSPSDGWQLNVFGYLTLMRRNVDIVSIALPRESTMGRETKIGWCDHTFNGVRGCAKVSPGCNTCYAESMSKRNPATLGVWGEEGTRVLGGPDYWANLDKWHRAAVREGALRRVFCYSLGDVFESPRKLANADVCAKGRDLLFDAIERLRPVPCLSGEPYKLGLIFLLLTKRPENVKRMVPGTWTDSMRPGGWPPHVWLGTSVENQHAAEERIPHLLSVPGVPIRFLSLEPLLERVTLRLRWLPRNNLRVESIGTCVDCGYHGPGPGHDCKAPTVGWLIPGGEGLGRRPCDLSWIRDIRDQGKAAGVPVFVKQMGSHPIESNGEVDLEHPKGEDPDEWPEDLRVREVPEVRL